MTELDAFEERLKEDPGIADVTWRSGGGGSGGPLLPFGLLAALAVARRRVRQRRPASTTAVDFGERTLTCGE